MGGYLGVMAKLGPFCSRDNCSLVRGGLERLITHLLVQSVHVWLVLEGVSPGAGLVFVVLLEGVGAMGVAGMLVGVEAVVEVLDILDGTFGCLLKVFLIDVAAIIGPPVEIILVSITFEI